MPSKIDATQSYTAIRQQVYDQANDKKADKTALRFTNAKGLYVKQGITNSWGNAAVRNAKFEDAISVVRTAINREFSRMSVGGRPIGDFIMRELGKEHYGDKLTVKDLRQIDTLLRGVLAANTQVAKGQGHDQAARLSGHATSMVNDAIGGGSHDKNADLALWKSAVTGTEAMRQAVIRDLKLPNPRKYAGGGDKAVSDDADKLIRDAGVRTSRGLTPHNIERLRQTLGSQHGSAATNVTQLHDLMTLRMKAQHAAPEMKAAADRVAKSAGKYFSVSSDAYMGLHRLSYKAGTSAAQLQGMAANNGVVDDPRKVYDELAGVANQAQRMVNRLPRDEADVMARFVKGNQAPNSFDALPKDTKAEFRGLMLLRQDLETIASNSHDLAMSIVPRDERSLQARPDIFTAKSLNRGSQLAGVPLHRLTGNIKVPESVYQKALPNKDAGGSGDALAMQNLRQLTESYNKASWNVQQALHAYRQNPFSEQHLSALVDAADRASAIADRLRTKFDLVQARNKGAAAPDLHSPSRRLLEHHRALNDIRRLASIDMSRMRHAAGQPPVQFGGDDGKAQVIIKVANAPDGGGLNKVWQIVDNLVDPQDKSTPIPLRDIAKNLDLAIDDISGDDLPKLLREIEKAGREAERVASFAEDDGDNALQQKAEAMAKQLGQAALHIHGLMVQPKGDDESSIASSDDTSSDLSVLEDDPESARLNGGQVNALRQDFAELQKLSLQHDVDIDDILEPLNRVVDDGTCSVDDFNALGMAIAMLRLKTVGMGDLPNALTSLQANLDDLEFGRPLVTIGGPDGDFAPDKAAAPDNASRIELNSDQIARLQGHLIDIEDQARDAGRNVRDLTLPLGHMISNMVGDPAAVDRAAAETLRQLEQVDANAELRESIQALRKDLEAL